MFPFLYIGIILSLFHSLWDFSYFKKTLNYIINWLSHFLSTLFQDISYYSNWSHCFLSSFSPFIITYISSLSSISYFLFCLWFFKFRFCCKHFMKTLIQYFTHFLRVLIYSTFLFSFKKYFWSLTVPWAKPVLPSLNLHQAVISLFSTRLSSTYLSLHPFPTLCRLSL